MRRHFLLHLVGSPQQYRVDNHAYRRLRIGALHRELSSQRGQRILSAGYDCVSFVCYRRHFCAFLLPARAHFWYKARGGLWCPETNAKLAFAYREPLHRAPFGRPRAHLVDARRNIRRGTTALDGVTGSWLLQNHKEGVIAYGPL